MPEKDKEAKFEKACPESAKKLKEQEQPQTDPRIQTVLDYIGIDRDATKRVVHHHWERFIRFLIEHSGEHWEEQLRPNSEVILVLAIVILTNI